MVGSNLLGYDRKYSLSSSYGVGAMIKMINSVYNLYGYVWLGLGSDDNELEL